MLTRNFRSAINPHLENLTTDSLLGLLLQEEEKLVEETKALQLQANVISHNTLIAPQSLDSPINKVSPPLKNPPVAQTTAILLVLLVDHLLALFVKYVRNPTTMLILHHHPHCPLNPYQYRFHLYLLIQPLHHKIHVQPPSYPPLQALIRMLPHIFALLPLPIIL
ncbi:hypothetical protein H5410_038105 [Solanum commersonii]|uniref:Uncharacterized protein n=1 Tax=Solanum commersonii TaxID=4109 RepID=A0A9J5Y945_SOLCO|nr:hypothetical protein H5410_038105 [Solanum commersonii]